MHPMDDQRHAARTTWLVGAGFLVVTVSSAVAVFRGRAAGDTASVAFVVATYVTLLLLFACLRAYERGPGASAGAGRSCRPKGPSPCQNQTCSVVPHHPAYRDVCVEGCRSDALLGAGPRRYSIVWALAAVTTIGGFVALFQPRP